jgi:predicted DNA binding CopG/RHH family protein
MTQRKTKLDPRALDPEELEILRAYEEGQLRRDPSSSRDAARLESAARETLRKDMRINIRLPSHDLFEIKRLAAREGIPYQTLISSILHKYATGELG